ncbi:23S rRNA (pseudouridine(1915)-N(3))-methyltransferase RlmH [Haploplasma axanthum]|uniref:Ribosomal RNA large subunit methyltransferase H n=1 Tax=Haploplasma axanthum TaxID=29552 RepID=A0A449BD13_HAPAX|nr:23S rRNA (pseudouridine(1915)-N(3))-methyltransferase RlmH [Haploplasma axanthum]VEU80343.1 ribosomal RNA large subunit methyltransferase H [Haploplasma axanthum]
MIKIITVGKVKNDNLNKMINYYLKQIPRKTEIITLKDEPNIDGIKKEALSILKQIKDTDYVITLEIKGNNYSSEEFAEKINEIENVNQGDIVFIIGGSYGLDSSVSEKSNLKLSFSRMTFPHQLMQLFLVEQVFRAYSIIKNHPYHK